MEYRLLTLLADKPGKPFSRVVEAGRSKRGFFLAADRSGYRIILKPQGLETTRWAPLATILTIAAALAVLSLTYHGIRHLFHPLETVRTGLARIGRGEFEHRIQVKRKDELGEKPVATAWGFISDVRS